MKIRPISWALLCVVIFLAFCLETLAQVRTIAIVRTHRIVYGNNSGSSFTVEIDGRQYLITAKHLVSGIKDDDSIRLLIGNGAWKEFKIKPIYCESPEVDIVALVLPEVLPAPLAVEPSSEGIILGGEVYLVGFPYGLATFHDGWPPMPFIKKGVLSAIDSTNRSRVIFYLDAHNNPGFSGGPVYFWDQNKQQSKFIGVISGFKGQYEEVLRPPAGSSIPASEIPPSQMLRTNKFVPLNSGIVVAYQISHIIDAIRKKPIGTPLLP